MKKFIMLIVLGLCSCISGANQCKKITLNKAEKTWFHFLEKKNQIVFISREGELVFDKTRSKNGYTACNSFEVGPNQFEYLSVQHKLITGKTLDRNKKYDIKHLAGSEVNEIDLYFLDFWVNFNYSELSELNSDLFEINGKKYLSYQLKSRKASYIDSLFWNPDVGVVAFKQDTSYFKLMN